jgi:hypothetical protein
MSGCTFETRDRAGRRAHARCHLGLRQPSLDTRKHQVSADAVQRSVGNHAPTDHQLARGIDVVGGMLSVRLMGDPEAGMSFMFDFAEMLTGAHVYTR